MTKWKDDQASCDDRVYEALLTGAEINHLCEMLECREPQSGRDVAIFMSLTNAERRTIPEREE